MGLIAKPAAKKTPARRVTVKSKPGKTPAGRRGFVAEVKAVAARVDSGEGRVYTREEALRELDLCAWIVFTRFGRLRDVNCK